MILHLTGVLGQALSDSLSRLELDFPKPKLPSHIYVFDSFGLLPLSVKFSGFEMYCFATSSGYILTPWFGEESENCRPCFERRYLANLDCWEHSPYIERALGKMERIDPLVRAFEVVPSMINVLARAIYQRAMHYSDRSVWYINSTKASIIAMPLIPVHGCSCTRKLNTRFPDRYSSEIMEMISQNRILRSNE